MRSLGRSVILVVNKCEGKTGQDGLFDAYSLGMGDPVAISAEHGQGMSELYDALEPYAGESEEADEEARDKPLQLAIVGRPNAGKSTLLNRLVGEPRAITGPEPGITRDAIPLAWSRNGRPVQLVDPARTPPRPPRVSPLAARPRGRARPSRGGYGAARRAGRHRRDGPPRHAGRAARAALGG